MADFREIDGKKIDPKEIDALIEAMTEEIGPDFVLLPLLEQVREFAAAGVSFVLVIRPAPEESIEDTRQGINSESGTACAVPHCTHETCETVGCGHLACEHAILPLGGGTICTGAGASCLCESFMRKDGEVWAFDRVAEPTHGIQMPGGAMLVNVHPQSLCEGRHCCIHNPSEHSLKDAPLNWRGDRGIMERICQHGIGHPDPDDAAYRASQGDDDTVHGCDGCCA